MLLLFIPLTLLSNEGMKYLKFVTHGPIKAKELYRASNIELPAWYEFWKKKEPKVSPLIINSLQETLANYYRSEGFYHAKITKKEDNTTVIFITEAGEPVYVKEIAVEGDIDFGRFVTFKKGERFSARKFVEIKKNIKRFLLEKGFCNAILDAKAWVDIVKNSVKLRFFVQKNRPCHIGKISIHTPPNIDEKVVRSRLTFESGDLYNLKKLNRSYSTISGLEAFDAIKIDQNKHDHTIDLDIQLEKKHKPIRESIGIGYETNYGPRGLLHWEQRNFKGGAKKLSFDAKYSKKEKFLQNNFFVPAFIKLPYLKNRYLDFKNEFSYSEMIYENFDERSIRDLVHLLKDFDTFSIDMGIGIERIEITKTADVCNVIDGDFKLLFPFAKLIIDHRDSKVDPRRGYYLSLYLEGGMKQILSSASYAKLFQEVRGIYTLGDTTLALKAKLGLINELESRIPESKLFFAGGAYSNRGFGFNRLGASDAFCEGVGGRTMIDTSVELVHPLFHKFSGALFLDSTMISSNSFTFSGKFRHSAGIGLHYDTPVGPIKLDIGFNLEESDQYAIHFLIGQSF